MKERITLGLAISMTILCAGMMALVIIEGVAVFEIVKTCNL